MFLVPYRFFSSLLNVVVLQHAHPHQHLFGFRVKHFYLLYLNTILN